MSSKPVRVHPRPKIAPDRKLHSSSVQWKLEMLPRSAEMALSFRGVLWCRVAIFQPLLSLALVVWVVEWRDSRVGREVSVLKRDSANFVWRNELRLWLRFSLSGCSIRPIVLVIEFSHWPVSWTVDPVCHASSALGPERPVGTILVTAYLQWRPTSCPRRENFQHFISRH